MAYYLPAVRCTPGRVPGEGREEFEYVPPLSLLESLPQESATMHYRNGREAKAGDTAVSLNDGVTGVLHCLQPGAQTCNARIRPQNSHDQHVTLKDCVHMDDLRKGADKLPNTDEDNAPEK